MAKLWHFDPIQEKNGLCGDMRDDVHGDEKQKCFFFREEASGQILTIQKKHAKN